MKENLISSSDLTDSSTEHQIRLEKIKEMEKVGIKPWPQGKEVTASCAQVIDEFCEGCEHTEKHPYAVAGRLMTRREHGKTIFCHIQDRTGRLQIYIKKDDLGEAAFHNFLQFVDIGDIVWFSGFSFKTKMGEITLHAHDFFLLSKCLYPLPEKFHGLVDIETVYRQRYLDLISNSESRHRFVQRSLIVREIRNFLDELDFLEVETPMLHPIPGGAAARPFVTHHNALNMELYLRVAPELYLKRLVVGGMERVYEINRNFRNEGISTKHNPEFTMLEFYMAYQDYNYGMDLVEQMLRMLVQKTCRSMKVQFGDKELDFESPFARISMHDAILKFGNMKADALQPQTIASTARNHGIELASANWGTYLVHLFEKIAEPNLINPTFITQFPVEISPLAKRDPTNPTIAARFELFAAGMELSNGFNELNDPFDQAERFKEQAQLKSAGDVEAHHYDADYVHALEYGLPPTVGVGIGIDRLVMLLTNATSIKDVILFPTLKRKE